MADHTDFLHAIAAHPEEDAPRLIYADWLEEQGDSDRAEFIRVQCELAQLPEEEPRRVGLEWKQNRLLRHAMTWLAALPVQPPWRLRNGTFYEFERGFLTALCVDTEEFLAHAPTLFAAAPTLRHMRFRHLDNRILTALAHCSFLARLTVMDLSYEGLTDARIADLIASPYLVKLTGLYLKGNEIDDSGAEQLAETPQLENLAALDLAYNRVHDEGALALARSRTLGRLAHLNLDRNPVSGTVLELLRQMFALRQGWFTGEQGGE